MDRLSKDADRRCKEDPNKESRLIPHPDVGQAVPRTEVSLTLKLAKKLAKFGTKAERQTDLRNYADRRTKVRTGKITEDLINQHAKEARRKLEGNKTIKHKRIDDMSAVYSIHSNVSRALRVRMPTKPNKTLVPATPQPPTETVIDFAP